MKAQQLRTYGGSYASMSFLIQVVLCYDYISHRSAK